uniref:Uncharacterized protein n=1 Tax=Ustilago esculenta TaxID=185366 RepID=A0A481SG25_9BASI|nr:hypothetical protein UEMT_2013 [Ustilago esculenta]
MASGLSWHTTSLLWNGHAPAMHTRLATVHSSFCAFASAALGLANPFPALSTMLINWVAHHHVASKSYNTVKHDCSVLRSWHVDLGLPTTAFNSPQLKHVVQGFKWVMGNPLPVTKLPITLPLLQQLVHALPHLCASPHNSCMF